MAGVYTIGADTHCSFTELAVISPTGRLVRRARCPTTIYDLAVTLGTLSKPRVMVIEEGPLADWIMRGLKNLREKVVVCDPRRNSLVAKDSDKDDAIDAEKIARLYKGEYIKEVYHAESFSRVVLKRRIALYHDRVRHRVSEANRLMAQLRQYGVFIHERDFATGEGWADCQDRLPPETIIRNDLDLSWKGYVMAATQVSQLRKCVIEMGRKEPIVRYWTHLPGISWIRAMTFFAYVDTPFRFRNKSSLWRYLGIGLERHVSGESLHRVRVGRRANHTLKAVIIGAATSVMRSKDNPFVDQFRSWINDGVALRNARRNVARSLATVMWGMWKTGEDYRPDWVGGLTRR